MNQHPNRLAAVSASHSGDWFHAVPVSSCGLKLVDEAIRIAVGLRLGIDLCTTHKCLVDVFGSHSFSCWLGFGRTACHHMLNDLVYCALVSPTSQSTKSISASCRQTENDRMDSSSYHGSRAKLSYEMSRLPIPWQLPIHIPKRSFLFMQLN